MVITQAQIDIAGAQIGRAVSQLLDKVSNKEQLSEIVTGLIPALLTIASADIPEASRIAVGSRLFHAGHGEFNERMLPLNPPAPTNIR